MSYQIIYHIGRHEKRERETRRVVSHAPPSRKAGGLETAHEKRCELAKGEHTVFD